MVKSRTGRCPPRAAEKYPRLAVAVVTSDHMSPEYLPRTCSFPGEVPMGRTFDLTVRVLI